MADIPESAISEKFLAGSGPGGQNVNKVATACQLRVNIYALGLAPDAFRRLKLLAGSKLTTEGELVILARRFRTQEANRADARARLSELIDAALVRPERRIKTKPSKAAKAKRVDSKKARSTVKAGRGRVRGTD
ncbi:alternative ribosome rescue aminoacyl-tRNA hydrolase ArfB [Sphingopyxis sp.]|uniref:alternative ribosome rescue aminoacyl-tRNA hydrolase ArfB n=1 Tax=Sphingopyxis sp. TaxID=1908224 RepID=UPI0010FA07BE|nr:alternative ribosome rescue aminoacyl-tRNA hydrolase ArfB [Sphingopyxis sp.]MBR2175064.1 aminoacyl-tRNA hydrolase [Sphingopyxis sp.]